MSTQITFEQLDSLMPHDIENNNVPMLIGESGIGKSSYVEDYAKNVLHTAAFTLACNQLGEKTDLTGCRLVPTGTKDSEGNDEYQQVFFPHQVIVEAIRYANEHPSETPILFMDEINRVSTPDVTSALLSIPTMRSLGNKKIPDNLKVVIAGNDKGNIVALDKASITRFVLYHMKPDLPTFMKVNPNLNGYVKTVLLRHPDYLLQDGMTLPEDDEEEDRAFDIEEFEEAMTQMTAPRTITALSDWLNSLTPTEIMNMQNTVCGDSNLLQEGIFAHCGETPFAVELFNEIINSNVTQKIITMPTEPAGYKELHDCTTIDEINSLVSTMTDKEKSSLLTYSLCSSDDNEEIIRSLVRANVSLGVDEIEVLAGLSKAQGFDRSNFDALSSIDSSITTALKTLRIL